MAYYLLTVQLAGARSYQENAQSKHRIDAMDLEDAQGQADDIIANHYRKSDGATVRLLDETGVVATRGASGEWNG